MFIFLKKSHSYSLCSFIHRKKHTFTKEKSLFYQPQIVSDVWLLKVQSSFKKSALIQSFLKRWNGQDAHVFISRKVALAFTFLSLIFHFSFKKLFRCVLYIKS